MEDSDSHAAGLEGGGGDGPDADGGAANLGAQQAASRAGPRVQSLHPPLRPLRQECLLFSFRDSKLLVKVNEGPTSACSSRPLGVEGAASLVDPSTVSLSGGSYSTHSRVSLLIARPPAASWR
jgi:hypothetical protein